MKGEIMVGSILFLKKTDINSIIPGAIYVIVCDNYVVLRRVRVSLDAPSVLRLETTNPDYDEMSIAQDSVKQIYRVVGNLKLY
jgi:SOS-response transcriptional repressor LexA